MAAPHPQPAPAPPAGDLGPYASWIAEIEPLGRAPPGAAAALRSFAGTRFSILMPGTEPSGAALATLESLRRQSNPDWEAVLPERGDARQALGPAAEDQRVVFVPCKGGADRGGALACLLAAAKGAWIAVLDAGDVLAAEALDEVAHALAHAPEAAILYGDEDEIAADGHRAHPQFKPSWSPELLHAYNYFGRLTLLSRDLAGDAGGFVAGQGAGAEWGLNLRAADAAEASGRRVERVPRVLCHRVSGSDRDRPAPSSAAAAQHRAALRGYWSSRGIPSPDVETQPDGAQRSLWDIPDPPLVSVIIPNHDSPDLLRRCVEGVLDHTKYRHVEIVIVENRSTDPATWALYAEFERRGVRVIRCDTPFNYSAVCNRGARIARGALLLFLNNDIEVIDPRWLGELVRVATLPGVGVVGTKLRYPNGELQHAGVAIGVHLYGLMFGGAQEGAWGVFGSPNTTRNWSAIMGACQMVSRVAFDRAGGFDEAYQIANSDVALCLHVLRSGERVAYTPFAALVHHEGATRGRRNPDEDMARAARELRRLGITEDPYLHPGLSGLDTAPRLRQPGEPDLRESLRRNAERFLAAVPAPEAPLDLFSDGDVAEAAGLPRAMVLWPPQPARLVRDRWSAARWVLDLLRGRPDLRARFPRALSGGAGGTFARWLTGEGARELALPAERAGHLRDLFEHDPAAGPRQLYVARDDLRAACPLGLLPPGRRGLAAWLLRRFGHEEGLRLEEVWWLLLSCAEDPAAELVRTYRLTPAWQDAHPYGLTVFGCHAFAVWVAERWQVPPGAAWLDPQGWPTGLSPAEHVRSAYAARDDWRLAHPRAFESAAAARALMTWLAGPAAGLPQELRTWCAAHATDVQKALE